MKHVRIAAALLLAVVFADAPVSAQDTLEKGKDYIFKEGLAAGPVGQYGRTAIHSDPVEYQLVTDAFSRPKEGGPVAGELVWSKITAGNGDWFQGEALGKGYFYAFVYSNVPQVMLLEASGHSLVYVNGTPRGGDVYAYGWVQHPVKLEKGRNEFLFRVSRGRVKARLTAPKTSCMLSTRDMTLPDLIVGRKGASMGAIRVINATPAATKGLVIYCQLATDEGEVVRDLPVEVGPMSTRKAGFLIDGPVHEAPGKVKATVTLGTGDGVTFNPLDSVEIELDVRAAGDHYKETFVSEIDGSVQYYAVSPGQIEGKEKPGLVLTLHGASVEGFGQARVYKAKPWCHVVAPTNRRPYGFDWEDWGRLDAMEVLDMARLRFGTDEKRTYLTGHSMGGHGTWYLGAVYPDRFGAIAPSAGWYSFWSYGGKDRDAEGSPLQELFARASNPSDTIALSRNFMQHGVYILHGDKDDNVPVEQARFMLDHLSKFHRDFAYYERPGAGHWWGGQCCDWPGLFDFLKNHAIPENRAVATVEFHTANPGISSRSRWVEIFQQIHPLKFSSVQITQDVKKRTFTGKTKNVAMLAIELGQLEEGDEVTIELDGRKRRYETGKEMDRFWLAIEDGKWVKAVKPAPEAKGPHRYGTFKDAFRHRVLFLFGTQGSEEENKWAFDRARFDAETFWYRGNASVDVLPDTAYDPELHRGRNVILYGNADTHGAWETLVGDSPVKVAKGKMVVGGREMEGDDLGCYFIWPKKGSSSNSVGVVAGTGLVGMKAANMNLYFIAGSGFPDLLVFGADMLESYFDGVRCVGYFGNDWSVENGEFAFNDR